MANSIWRHCRRPLPTKSRRTGERTGRPRDALAELPWDKLRLSAVFAPIKLRSPTTAPPAPPMTAPGAGQTQQCQPDASWRRWTSRPKACVDRLQRQQLGLKPRRLMRSAADLDAGVEVEPGPTPPPRVAAERVFPASGPLNAGSAALSRLAPNRAGMLDEWGDISPPSRRGRLAALNLGAIAARQQHERLGSAEPVGAAAGAWAGPRLAGLRRRHRGGPRASARCSPSNCPPH